MAKRKFTLPEKEVNRLKSAYHQSKDANFSQRLLAVRLYGTDYPTAEIVELVGCNRSSLMEWVQKYQEKGIEGLKDQRRGGNHYKLTVAQKAETKEKVQQYTPKELLGEMCATASGTHWTHADLKQLIYQEWCIIYQSDTSYRLLFQEFGFSYQRTEKVYKSRSAYKVAEFEEQLEKN